MGSSGLPVFVVGNDHSGTSMLFQLLSKHPNVYPCRRESKYFQYRALIANEYRDLAKDETARALVQYVGAVAAERYLPPGDPVVAERSLLNDREIGEILARAETRTYGSLFKETLDYLTSRSGKSIWIEKTPAHVFDIGTILAEAGSAKFVEMVRDPRDVLASKKRRRSLLSTSHYGRDREAKALELAYDPVWDALAWRAGCGAAAAAAVAYPGSVLSVRYEALVAEPHTALERVCRFIDVQMVPEMVAPVWRSEAGEINLASEIDQRSVGRWRSDLSPEETTIIELISRRYMETHGYTRSRLPLPDMARTLPLVARSLAEPLTRLARRARLGGPRYAAMTALGYLRRLRDIR